MHLRHKLFVFHFFFVRHIEQGIDVARNNRGWGWHLLSYRDGNTGLFVRNFFFLDKTNLENLFEVWNWFHTLRFAFSSLRFSSILEIFVLQRANFCWVVLILFSSSSTSSETPTSASSTNFLSLEQNKNGLVYRSLNWSIIILLLQRLAQHLCTTDSKRFFRSANLEAFVCAQPFDLLS